MQCKSLWIKASAKCINVNVNVNLSHEVYIFMFSDSCIVSYPLIQHSNFGQALVLVSGSFIIQKHTNMNSVGKRDVIYN